MCLDQKLSQIARNRAEVKMIVSSKSEMVVKHDFRSHIRGVKIAMSQKKCRAAIVTFHWHLESYKKSSEDSITHFDLRS